MPKIEIEINEEAFAFFTESAARERRSIEDEIAVGLESAAAATAKYRRLGEQLLSVLSEDDEDDDEDESIEGVLDELESAGLIERTEA